MIPVHGEPCDAREASFCMNGGTCFKITAMNTLSCICSNNYKGSRCEQLQLFTASNNPAEAGLVAALVVVGLLILALLAVIIYYVHRMLKIKQQSPTGGQREYWRVKPRV